MSPTSKSTQPVPKSRDARDWAVRPQSAPLRVWNRYCPTAHRIRSASELVNRRSLLMVIGIITLLREESARKRFAKVGERGAQTQVVGLSWMDHFASIGKAHALCPLTQREYESQSSSGIGRRVQPPKRLRFRQRPPVDVSTQTNDRHFRPGKSRLSLFHRRSSFPLDPKSTQRTLSNLELMAIRVDHRTYTFLAGMSCGATGSVKEKTEP